MYHKPGELRLHTLDSIEPGTLIQLVGRKDDIPCAVKLRGAEDNNPRILLLGGEYSFEDVKWSEGDQLATIVCDADKLLIELGVVDEKTSNGTPGCILLHEGGSTFNARRERRYHTAIDLSTWDSADTQKMDGPCVLHSVWKLGYLNEKSEFIAVFSKD